MNKTSYAAAAVVLSLAAVVLIITSNTGREAPVPTASPPVEAVSDEIAKTPTVVEAPLPEAGVPTVEETGSTPMIVENLADIPDDVPLVISDYPGLFGQIDEITPEWIEANFVLPRAQSPSPHCETIALDSGHSVCWEEFGRHPYLQYSVESLKPIATDDAEAAAALAVLLLHIDKKASMRYALLASELSGKLGPVATYLGSVNFDQDSIDELLDLYALARHIEFEGWDRPVAYSFEHILKVKGLSKTEILSAAEFRLIEAADPEGGE